MCNECDLAIRQILEVFMQDIIMLAVAGVFAISAWLLVLLSDWLMGGKQ